MTIKEEIYKHTQEEFENKNEIKFIEVETLFIGGGPATLGDISNAY